MVKRLATSPHDPLGITDSVCKNHSVMVSVQYGLFNSNIPIESMIIDKSRVADSIAMHTSWRSKMISHVLLGQADQFIVLQFSSEQAEHIRVTWDRSDLSFEIRQYLEKGSDYRRFRSEIRIENSSRQTMGTNSFEKRSEFSNSLEKRQRGNSLEQRQRRNSLKRRTAQSSRTPFSLEHMRFQIRA
ncbi:hypothetical protein F511_11636 [Dorcoceras hygrometricum]|uniref:Uncharacterized protein n=1 Tax=Dorcoceras hygrometricum TaxID=472368 RepID=A0A2Z7AL57_9LAMI|nr:hypothetical protein F511_11636 [Dorcoceras hygrometricum]